MNERLKAFLKRHGAAPSVGLACLWPSLWMISYMRRLNDIQLSAEQLQTIERVVKAKAPCRFLVFGLGNDSVFWHRLNRRGQTVFLEDNPAWFDKVTRQLPTIQAHLVNYETRRSDWQRLLATPSLLAMTLPDNLAAEPWDVIFVDAPPGYDDQVPGRMKSIYLAANIITKPGDIFVHDCDREVEDVYCNTFLKPQNLKAEVKAPVGFLRHYAMR